MNWGVLRKLPLMIFLSFNFSRFMTLLAVICRYKAVGIRLDSGDLAYLSTVARKFFCGVERELNVPDFGKMIITASNDLNEETVDALNKQVTSHSP